MIKLSPTSLNLFLECPRCFWLALNKDIKRPGPPVATITTGLDRVIKEYFNRYRLTNTLPPILAGKLPGKLMANLPSRGWLEFIEAKLDAKLGGYLDECIELKENLFAVLDHKTRGSAPDSVHKAYQLQMDTYTFLLEKNNFPTAQKAYLVYYVPQEIIPDTDFKFEALVKEIKTDPERAKEVFYKALEILHSPIPAINRDCGFCNWTQTLSIK